MNPASSFNVDYQHDSMIGDGANLDPASAEAQAVVVRILRSRSAGGLLTMLGIEVAS